MYLYTVLTCKKTIQKSHVLTTVFLYLARTQLFAMCYLLW